MLRTVFGVNVGIVVVIIYLLYKLFLLQKAGAQDYMISKQINCLCVLIREQKQKLFYLRGITKMPGMMNDLESCNFNVKALECY